MAKYTSGRVKKFPQSGITSDRYEFLGLEQAEPDLGNPVVGVASTGAKPHPSLFDGNHYALISTTDEIGSRYWAKPSDLYNVKISSDTTTNQNWYVAISSVTSGSQPGVFVSPNKFQINPSTGAIGIGTIIDIVPYDTLNNGTLSWEGSAGQLFSITNNLTSGSIFSVNDVSGIPSIDVDANGTIQLAPYGGNIGVGTTNPNNKLDVVGNAYVSGNIGINTTNPQVSLDVDGNIRVSGITTSSKLIVTAIGDTTTGGGQIYLNGSVGNRIDFNQNGTSAPSFTTRSVGTKIVLYPSVTGTLVDYGLGIENNTLWYSIEQAVSTKQHRWYAGITQLADLKGSGELSIGSTVLTGTASQKLQVTGGAYISGNTGIGNTNPGEKLQVDGNIRVGSSTTQNYIAFRGTSSDDQIPYTHTFIGERLYESQSPESSELLLFKGNDIPGAFGPDRIRLAAGEIRFDIITGVFGTFDQVATSPNVINKMILTGDGNLGIGTTNPTQSLDVNGNIRLRSGLYDFYNNVGAAGSVLISTGVGVSWTTPSVNVLDDTSTNATYYVGYSTVTSGVTTSFGISSTKLQFNPSSGTLSATVFTSLSDKDLKKNISIIENPIEKISTLNGVTFNWTTNEKPSIGLIAQEVEKVFPELVSGNEFKSINYDGLVGVLVECVKDLQAQINSLKNA